MWCRLLARARGAANPVGAKQRVRLWGSQLCITATPLGHMIHIDAYHHGIVAYMPENALLPRLGEELVTIFAPMTDQDRAGLYLASANAGAHSAVSFWREAQRDGVRFASPELFPWTLANAPCSWLSRRFGVRGPNVTYLGGAD